MITPTPVDQSSSSKTTAAEQDALQRSAATVGDLASPPPSVRPSPSTARPASTKTRMFGLAVTAVIAGVLISVLGLLVTGPDAEATTVSAAAAAFGMVGMYSAIGGGLLAVIAALRSQS